jgi:hypothetical protein
MSRSVKLSLSHTELDRYQILYVDVDFSKRRRRLLRLIRRLCLVQRLFDCFNDRYRRILCFSSFVLCLLGFFTTSSMSIASSIMSCTTSTAVHPVGFRLYLLWILCVHFLFCLLVFTTTFSSVCMHRLTDQIIVNLETSIADIDIHQYV